MLFQFGLQLPAINLLAATVSALGVMLAVPSLPAHADPSRPIQWLFGPPGVEALSEPAISKLLNNAKPFVFAGPRKELAIPPAWNAVRLAHFKSFSHIKRALEEGSLPPDVKGILYDNEKWEFTPEEEQRDPARYHKLAGELVHAHGLLLVAAPAVNLVTVLAPEDTGKRYYAFLRLNLAADAARYADIIDIQAQGSQVNTAVFANFLKRAAAQARAANPKVVVLAGVSTNPSGQQVSASEVLSAISATRDIVDGYWLNIPRPGPDCPRCNDFRPDIAIEVLQSLAGS